VEGIQPGAARRYATYVWNEQGTDAALAPADGAVSAVASAPGGVYTIPSRLDCLACHEGGAVPVLGFSALQLSPDRDPLAPHAESPRTEHVDLRTLVARGLLRDPPASTLERPPRIEAPTATARAALGYLHGNCGHCHNAVGSLAGLDFVLAQSAVAPKPGTALGSLVDRSSRYRPRAGDESKRLVAGRADASVIAIRMQSTNPLARMPPLGVEVIDDEGVALVRRWIQHDVPQPAEVSP
jgi:mono/diheme cytochrome c family protein